MIHGCAIKVDNSGQYIYISIRGDNSISVFDIQDGKLKLIQNVDSRGECPKDITIDSYGKYLFCANQNSNKVAIFEIDSGRLKFKNEFDLEEPSCIFVDSGN